MAKAHRPKVAFLVKSEPETYSYEDLEREGMTTWNGVRNATARNNIRAMQERNQLFFYHSGKSRAIVGLAEVVRSHYPEPGAEQWSVVDVRPLRRLLRPVTLAELRDIPELADWLLIRHSRLSVVPVSADQQKWVFRLEAKSSS